MDQVPPEETQKVNLNIQVLLDALKRNPNDSLLQHDAWIDLEKFLHQIYWHKTFKASRGPIENHQQREGFLHDAVQDSILKVFKEVHQQGEEGGFTWLRRLFKNVLTDNARREGLIRSDPKNHKGIEATIRGAFSFDETKVRPEDSFHLRVGACHEVAKLRSSHSPTQADLEARLAILTDDEWNHLEMLVFDGTLPPRGLLEKIKSLCSCSRRRCLFCF
jgi:DNA-directed RNA polymerase specialized sigma24 family protein